MTHDHRPGDRLVPFGDFHLNVSLIERRRQAGTLATTSLGLGVRQYCHSLGLTGDTPQDRLRTQTTINWDTVDALKGEPRGDCVAVFTGQGVRVLDGLDHLVRAFLDNVLVFEAEVIDAQEIGSLMLIPHTPEALRAMMVDDFEDEDDHHQDHLDRDHLRALPMNELSQSRKRPKTVIARTGRMEFVIPQSA